MDATKHLLRGAVYLFYPPPAAVILETLLHHGVLFEDDLVKLCQLHRKVLRSHAGSLLNDKIVSAHVQKEDFQGRLFSRTYYYIHFIEAIDAIKWKVHCIVKQMKEDNGALSEPQGYVCPRCGQKYTLLDAVSQTSEDHMHFECKLCGEALEDDDISQEQRVGQEKLERLMALLEPIIQYLKDIDDDVIEDNNFESSLVKAVPAFAQSLAAYSVVSQTPAAGTKKETPANSYYAPSGSSMHKRNNADAVEAAKRGDATIHVSITADDEDLKRERAKKEQRNEKLRQNALPSWHQASTVGEEARSAAADDNSEPLANVSIVDPVKREDVNVEEMDALSRYYEQLKERQDREDVEEEGAEDEEWADTTNAPAGTLPPSTATSAATASNTDATESTTSTAVKREAEDEVPDFDAEEPEEHDPFDDLDEDDIDLDMFD